VQLQDADSENLADMSIVGNNGTVDTEAIIIKFNMTGVDDLGSIISASLYLSMDVWGGYCDTRYKAGIENQGWNEDSSYTEFVDNALYNRSTILNACSGDLNEDVADIISYAVSQGYNNVSIILDAPDRDDEYNTNTTHITDSTSISDQIQPYMDMGDETIGAGGLRYYSRQGFNESERPLLTITYYNLTNITISDCTTLDIDSATYYLDTNISNSTTGSCMDITADNVILDCQGNIIDGNDAADYGIKNNWTKCNYSKL